MLKRQLRHAWNIFVALERVGLAGPGLPVCKYCAVEPTYRLLDEVLRLFEDVLLSGTLWEDMLELEVLPAVLAAWNCDDVSADLVASLAAFGFTDLSVALRSDTKEHPNFIFIFVVFAFLLQKDFYFLVCQGRWHENFRWQFLLHINGLRSNVLVNGQKLWFTDGLNLFWGVQGWT